MELVKATTSRLLLPNTSVCGDASEQPEAALEPGFCSGRTKRGAGERLTRDAEVRKGGATGSRKGERHCGEGSGGKEKYTG